MSVHSLERQSDSLTDRQGRWVVCQLGARENYMVARAIASSGKLSALITDAWQTPGSLAGRLSGRLKDRYHPQLAMARIETPGTAHLVREFGSRYLGRRGWGQIIARNDWFQAMAANRLRALTGQGVPCDTVFAYSYAAGSIFRMAKSLGLTTVLGQIDPGPVEDEIVADLYRDAGPSNRYERIPDIYWARWQEEIALSDVVVANSEWSKQALLRVGVSEAKISIVPLAYDAPLSAHASPARRPSPRSFTLDDPLKLLFLGQVTFRKGVGPLLEAIQSMPTAPIRLDIVGDVQIDVPPAINADVRVVLHGPAQRSEVHPYYVGADLFVFPTLSDGFGMTQLEAMAHGLPVLASRYCGAVVEHGVNGFVLDDVTPDAIRAVLGHILADPCRVSAWRDNARISAAFSKEALAANLLGLRIDR